MFDEMTKENKVDVARWRADPKIGGRRKMLEMQLREQAEERGKKFIYAKMMDYLIDLGMNAHDAKEKPVQSNLPAEKAKPKAKRFNFKQELINLGANADDAQLFMDVRKQKKAVNSEQAFKMFVDGLGHFTVAQAVSICAGEQWKGFKVSWANNLNPEQKKRYSFMEMARGEHLIDINPDEIAQRGKAFGAHCKKISETEDYAAQFDALRIEDTGAK
jgi:hypothetical protein